MYIHHIAIWTRDIELMKDFYTKYFGCIAGSKYENTEKHFQSYFLSFESGSKIELMYKPEITSNIEGERQGIAHIAIKVDSKEMVNEITARLKRDGYRVISLPRLTGDGYYESCILDPEGNRVEIVF